VEQTAYGTTGFLSFRASDTTASYMTSCSLWNIVEQTAYGTTGFLSFRIV
jgi:hypothetical protein